MDETEGKREKSLAEGGRTFSDKEVSLILKRAIDLQAREANIEKRSSGLARDDIARIAAESGIGAGYLEQAIRECEGGGKSQGAGERFFGAPSSLGFSEKIPVSLPKEELETLVPVVQNAFKASLIPSLIGNTLTFHAEGARTGKSISFSIVRKEDRLALDLSADYGDLKGGLFGGMMGGFGGSFGISLGVAIGLGALQSWPFAVLFSLASIGLSWLLARGIFRSTVNSDRKKFARLVGELRERLTGAGRAGKKTARQEGS